MSTKTAAMLLNEICAKCRTRPDFTYRATVTQPFHVFECTCTIANYQGQSFTTVALHGTKKGAMQLAAELMINSELKIPLSSPEAVEALLDTPNIKISDALVNPNGPSLAGPSFALDDATEALNGNPVQDLEVFCEEESLPCPKHWEGAKYGEDHDPIFEYWCRVGEVERSGASKKKKISKRIAFWKVYKALVHMKNPGGVKEMKIVEPSPTQVETDQDVRCLLGDGEQSGAGAVPLVRRIRQSRDVQNSPMNESISGVKEDWEERQDHFLKLKAGEVLKKLLYAIEEIAEQFPKRAFPVKEITEWLKGQGGAGEFFSALQDEMKFSVSVVQSVRERNDAEAPNSKMLGMFIKFPKGETLGRHPTAVAFGQTLEEAEEKAKIQLMVYLGVMCFS